MNIPIPASNTKNIYDYGFDAGLNRGIPDNSTGVVYDAVGDSLNAAQVLSGGNLNLKTLSIGGLVRQVAPGDDLQAAIDAVNREGGGTIQLLAKTYQLYTSITMRSNVFLRGVGKNLTVIDFGGLGNNIIGTSVSSFGISDLTITGSKKSGNSGGAINMPLCDTGFIENVSASSGNTGLVLNGAVNLRVINCNFNSNTSKGLDFQSTNSSTNIAFLNDTFNSNTNGATLVGAGDNTEFINCTFSGNSSHGIDQSTGGTDVRIIGCRITENAQGIEIGEAACYLLGNIFRSNSSYDISFGGILEPIIAIGNLLGTMSIQNSARLVAMNNSNMANTDEYKVIRATNTSGGALRDGNVVIIKSVASGNEMTTTTTNGDKKVWAVANQSIANNAEGLFLTLGKTTTLYANNSGASLAVGDYLSTYSHAYYAKKAIAGDMAFAICLEAPTTSTAAVDALLISPRLI